MARKRAHEHADERWLLTYADMITLLMALFMVMFSMAVVNKGKFDELAKSLRESFAGPLDRGGTSILNVGTPNPTAQANSELSSPPNPIQASNDKLVKDRLERQLRTAQAVLTRRDSHFTTAGWRNESVSNSPNVLYFETFTIGHHIPCL